MSTANTINLGLSPCPNDTFIFHAWLKGIVELEYPIAIKTTPHLADVQELNQLALTKKLEVTKISVGALPYIHDHYQILSSGAALGWKCGPLIVGRKNMSLSELENATIAIPGSMTTANLLLDLNGKFKGKRKEMIFSEIMPAIRRGDADLGVIIHEGRFTYPEYNLQKVLDLGEWWEESFHIPLPLGVIVIRRDLPHDLAKSIEKTISKSLDYAWENPHVSANFIKQNAQELSESVTQAHIKTFVTDFSRDLGPVGRDAIQTLIKAAMAKQDKRIDKSLFVE